MKLRNEYLEQVNDYMYSSIAYAYMDGKTVCLP